MSRVSIEIIFGTKLILAVALLSVPAACQAVSTQKSSSVVGADDSGFYKLGSKEQVKLGVPVKALRKGSTGNNVLPVAPKGSYSGSDRKYVSAALNSRAGVDPASGEWKIKWKSEIPVSTGAISILEFNGSIVIEADEGWFLFDAADAKQISNGELGASGIVLYDDGFYAADSTGMIVGRKLSDGKRQFALSLFFGNDYERTFLHRNGRRLIVVSRERELDPQKSDTKEESLVELYDLGDPPQTDRDGILASAKAIKHFTRKTNILRAAANGEKLVLATQNRIYATDLELNFTHAWTGDFMPRAISLDETGRIYALIDIGAKRFLWIVSTSGEIVAEFEIPERFELTARPPAVGYDHTVFLSAADEILAVDQRGKLLWTAKLPSPIRGLVVTPDKKLLVSSGRELLTFDSQGKKTTMFVFDENIVTAPTISRTGDILVATERHLMKLTATQK